MKLEQSVVARVCIFTEGKLLVVKRGNEGQADDGYWELPGGMVEPGEDPEQTAVREVQEEIGLRINPKRVSWVSSLTWPKAEPRYHVISIDYVGILEDKEDIKNIKLTSEHSDWKLIAEDKLKKLEPLRELMGESLRRAFKANTGQN